MLGLLCGRWSFIFPRFCLCSLIFFYFWLCKRDWEREMFKDIFNNNFANLNFLSKMFNILMVHRNLIKIDCRKKSDKTTPVSVFTGPPQLRVWFVMIFWLNWPGKPSHFTQLGWRSDYQVRPGRQHKNTILASSLVI